MSINQIAARILNAQSTHNSKYYTPGDYIAVIRDVIAKDTRNGRPIVVIETEIRATNNPTEHPIGSLATQAYMQDTNAGPGNTKTAIRDILGVTDEQLEGEAGQEVIIRCLSPDPDTGKSPLAGVTVRVTAINRPTTKGQPFTLTTFRKAAENEKLVGPPAED